MIPRKILLVILGLVLAGTTAFAQRPSDAEVHKILADRVGAENRGIAINRRIAGAQPDIFGSEFTAKG